MIHIERGLENEAGEWGWGERLGRTSRPIENILERTRNVCIIKKIVNGNFRSAIPHQSKQTIGHLSNGQKRTI